MAPADTANPAGARAAEADREQDVVMTKEPTKPQGKLKPKHAVDLSSSSDSYESEEAANKPPAPKTPESPEAAAKAPKTPESPEAAAKEAEPRQAPKARRNRRAMDDDEGMVKCPICWKTVKKDGLESHQLYSSYCAEWRKKSQKAEKGQQKDDEDVKKACPHCDRQFNKKWDLLQHCARVHPTTKEARECWEQMRGSKTKGAGSANRSTDCVRLRSRIRDRGHDSRSRPRARGESRSKAPRPRRSRSRRASSASASGSKAVLKSRPRRRSPSPTPGSSRSSKPGAGTVLESFLQTTTRILDMQDRKG